MATQLAILSIILPWLGALIVWLVGDGRPRSQHLLASAFAILSGYISLCLIPYANPEIILQIPLGSVFGDFTLIADGLGVFLAVVAAVVGGIAVIFSIDYMKGEAQIGRYYSLTLLFIGAMIGLVLSGSLLFMFIFWEITAFCSYALISFHNDDPKAVAGGIKALIITQLGGIGLLAGAILCYVFLNSYQINDLLAHAGTIPPALLSLLAYGFLIAAAAKSAQVPLHTWLPDAMEAPTPISALIHAATMVNAGVYLLARFYPAFDKIPGWSTTVMVVGLLSALLAALMALVSNDLKRALAYSTISQLGYMFFAIGAGVIFASQFHLLSHSVFKALLFLGAGAVIHAVGTRDMRQMGGLGKAMPNVRIVFIIGALALAGLPITNGFFSKELVLEGGLAFAPMWAYGCMLLGVAITGLYTTRMVWMVFYGVQNGLKNPHDAPVAMRISLYILALGVLTTWLLVGPFSHLLSVTLPFHDVHAEDTITIINEILTAPTTWLVMVVGLIGVATWYFRSRFTGLVINLHPVIVFIRNGMGFEWLNRQGIDIVQSIASAFRRTQTGQLNWNIVGILGGFLIVLALVVIIGV